jgi:hypothetical protein
LAPTVTKKSAPDIGDGLNLLIEFFAFIGFHPELSRAANAPKIAST